MATLANTTRCAICSKEVSGVRGLGQHTCAPTSNTPKPTHRPMLNGAPGVDDDNNVIPDLHPDVAEHPRLFIRRGQAQGVFDEDESIEETWDPVIDEDSNHLDMPSRTANTLDMHMTGMGDDNEETSSHAAPETSQSTILIHPYELDGVRAGESLEEEYLARLDKEDLPFATPNIEKKDFWFPFASQHDFELCSWFSRAHTSQGKINEYLHEPLFDSPSSAIPGAMHSSAHMHACIYNIPYGIRQDEWMLKDIFVNPQVRGGNVEKLQVIFRPIERVLEFLLGHRPFAPDLSWAPVKKYYGEGGSRVYDEMHTGTWWWDTQAKLEPGATLVPVLTATDKTLMTQLRGDRTAWPLYVSIGNLNRRTRRSQAFPGSILLALLPQSRAVTKSSDDPMARQIKSRVYHESMRAIFKPLEEGLSRDGFLVSCADGKIRQCYPVLAPMSVDYEEVCLICGIKNGRQCPRCEVVHSDLSEIRKQWPKRDHESMQAMFHAQRAANTAKEDAHYIHPTIPFAWHHPFTNLYQNMAMDMLHGLQKGVFRDLVNWTGRLIADLVPATVRASATNPKISRTYKQSPGLIQLDSRFAAVPRFQGLKVFTKFSRVQQWTGNEERDLIRIWMPVVTPILLSIAPAAVAYSRALIDFILVAQSRRHDERTLLYLEQAIYRIHSTRHAFFNWRPTRNDEEPDMNYYKFHALSHYAEFIREFGAPNGYDAEHFEAAHKFMLKDFYDRTNKNDNYLEQIASHNTRVTNLKAMSHHITSYFSLDSKAHKAIEAEVTSLPNTPALLSLYKCRGLKAEMLLLYRNINVHPKSTTTVALGAQATRLVGFIEAMAVFVTRERARRGGRPLAYDPGHRCLDDSSWIEDFPIQFYTNIRTWKPSGKDEADSQKHESEFLRCVPNWRNKGARNDFCWVQVFPEEASFIANPPTSASGASRKHLFPKKVYNPVMGRRVGQIQAIISIIDITQHPQPGQEYPRYQAALIDTYPFINEPADPYQWDTEFAMPHPDHGMIEVIRADAPTATHPRILRNRQFHSVGSIHRSAHVVPHNIGDIERVTDRFYINNYVDWDEYNFLYGDSWQRIGRENAKEYLIEYNRLKGISDQDNSDPEDFNAWDDTPSPSPIPDSEAI